jgi:hypothetical protein
MEDAIWFDDEYGRHTVGACVRSRCATIENRIKAVTELSPRGLFVVKG